jgi:hypothetical protein
MFNALKADSKLSEADIKERRLSLRVFAYEAQSVCLITTILFTLLILVKILDDEADFNSVRRLSAGSMTRPSTHRSNGHASLKPSAKRKASGSMLSFRAVTSNMLI